ncbi:hypothetical protein KL86DPRO_70107 [uncultured delta proteobacterium]|uniref:DUF6371 domain-containing protein n=1 Tax=uncultured delta proteobacterium TaxID=34034 RepID=A0A212KH32_9DELT|nr:hypothetical protein KL86DPRO_70107 [uncultured delta proteobacterium]
MNGGKIQTAQSYSLCGLDRLAAMPPGSPVLLVEDEKTADAAQKLFPNYVCMAWNGDTQFVGMADFSPLRDRNVIIWPHNDAPGHDAARDVVSMLERAGAYPLLLPLPESLPDKWSLADPPPKGFDPCAYLGRAGLPPMQLPVETTDDAIRPWPVLPREALPGLAGEFVALATRGSEADPAAVLITFLARFGAEIYGFAPGKGPYIRVGETRHPPRLYAAIAGASSRARKGTSAKPILRAFKEIPAKWRQGPPVADHTGGPLSSGEGLAFRLREREEGAEPDEGENTAGQPEDKRLFVLDEELAAAAANMKREGNTLSMALRSFWDSGDYEPLTKNAQVRVREAHVGIVTHMGILLTRWFETEEQKRKEYTINNINTEFEAILSHNEELRTLLQKIKPDANLEEFQENTRNLLRIAMPMGTVTFGKQKKPSMESILKKIMTDRDAADFADQEKAADEEVGEA